MLLNRRILQFVACSVALTLSGGCALFSGQSAAESADVYVQLGMRYLSMNKFDSARDNLSKALEKDRNNVQAHNGMAFLYEKMNLPAEAIKHYEIALHLDATDMGVQNNYGRFLCEQKQYERGLSLLKQAATTPFNNRPWLALTNAGRCEMAMGQQQKAEPYFQQALLTNSSYAPALAELQKLSYQRNDFNAANDYLQRYLTVSSHTAETLWIAIHTERALGNNELATEYQNLLLKKFPLSDEAHKIKSVLW
ncbi:type IV pilus biogenesis/stability protein PilW [Crenothrix sp.]|uniref:type IV pilus biogenesis/stability protein PilW n=1 Tax=Crenothrix sp. TaxID=3100433 RepID=UPI00374CE0D2